MLDGLYFGRTEVREYLQTSVDALVFQGFTTTAAHGLSHLARDRMLELADEYQPQMDRDRWEQIIRQLNEVLYHHDGYMSASMLEEEFFRLIK